MNNFIEFVQSWTDGGKYSIFLFPILVIFLLISSFKIVKYSLIIINKTKFGAGFFGATIIALVTSFPELITEIIQSASGYPQNGLGDDIGSNAFSTFLIALSALFFTKKLFLNVLSKWTKISIIISFTMSLILTIGLFFVGKDLKLGSIGIIPLILFLCYLFTIYLSTKYGNEDLKNKVSNTSFININKAILQFCFFSIGIVLSAILINVNLSAFQRDLNIKSDSIGGLLLASTTSLPEIIVFFALFKKNELTMAVSSLTGSHFFNLGIIFFGDLIYTSGPSFNKVEMKEQMPVAILNTLMLMLLIFHFTLARKFRIYKKNKFVYFSLPFIMVLGYVIGWTLILSLN